MMTYECRSAGMTEMFKMRPVLEYASLKVIEPRVKKVHWWALSIGVIWEQNTDLSCPSMLQISNSHFHDFCFSLT